MASIVVFVLAFVPAATLVGLVIAWRGDRRWDRSWKDWCKAQDAPGWPLRFHLLTGWRR